MMLDALLWIVDPIFQLLLDLLPVGNIPASWISTATTFLISGMVWGNLFPIAFAWAICKVLMAEELLIMAWKVVRRLWSMVPGVSSSAND